MSFVGRFVLFRSVLYRRFHFSPLPCYMYMQRVDVIIMQGPVSAYFTVFSWPYLKVHATKLENADQLYARQLGNPESIFKVRMNGL